jgi:hypothetical protein
MNNYLDIVPTEKHLGFPLGASSNKHLIENLCKEIMSKTNMLYCNFKHLPIDALYKLFRTYCTPLYGCQLNDFTSRDFDRLLVSWRKAIRFLVQLPPTTHCVLLPLICDDIPFCTQLHRRVAKFYHFCTSSPNIIVRSCAEAALHSTSCLGRTLTLLSRMYNCQKPSLIDHCHSPDVNNQDSITASLIRDLLNARRKHIFPSALSYHEIYFALNALCTV